MAHRRFSLLPEGGRFICNKGMLWEKVEPFENDFTEGPSHFNAERIMHPNPDRDPFKMEMPCRNFNDETLVNTAVAGYRHTETMPDVVPLDLWRHKHKNRVIQ